MEESKETKELGDIEYEGFKSTPQARPTCECSKGSALSGVTGGTCKCTSGAGV